MTEQQHESSQQSEENSQQSNDRSELIASGTFDYDVVWMQLTDEEIDRTIRLLLELEREERKLRRSERRNAAEAQQQTQNVAVKQEICIDLTAVKKEEAPPKSPTELDCEMWHCLHIDCKRYFSTPWRHR